jgi:hypothetical protein
VRRRIALCLALSACGRPARHAPADAGGDAAVDAPTDAPPLATATITTTVNSTRFVVREHMLAAGEMQISGEPLAEAMGRQLAGYSRDLIPPDIYLDPSMVFWVDLAGFSSAVESYEYSKQPMNGLAFEFGAGTSLVHAPLVDTDGATGAAATAHLVALIQRYAAASNAAGKWVFPAGTWPTSNAFGDINPSGIGTGAANPLGWPGIWPTAHVFASFDPAIDPTSAIDLQCSISSDDNPSESALPLVCSDFECDATTLHLRDRAAQVDATITPGADGFSGWKYGLWVLNYLQVMHDSTNAAVSTVADADLANVGSPNNQIVGADGDGKPTAAGTYLGSSDIEGFQAQMFVLEVDNRAEDWLARLTTTDGATLSGFASRLAALQYDYAAPLRWFPARIAVSETPDGSGFGAPSYALASPNSSLLDLIGLAMGYAEFYALTDLANHDVGGSQPARAYFDGDPFALDDQLPDGEPTLHDRALAMMRVALVNIDRLHVDPTSGLLVDDVTMIGAMPMRGHTLSTPTLAYSLIGLRTVLRSLSSQLELYSNNTPDTAVAWTPLDMLPIRYPGNAQLTFSQRFEQLLRAHARLLLDHLTDASGRAYSGWDVAANAPIDDSDVLDAHAAAIRGLFAAYLATGDTRYRDRALVVFARVERVFYDPVARIYAVTAAPVDSVDYTPLRFALLQSALRDMYELVAARPGGEALEPVLEDRIGRLNKLVLNGWDDRNRDKLVDWPSECTNVVAGVPQGGLQMGERVLSGEAGRLRDEGAGSGGPPTLDREHDCVPAINFSHLPAALADSVTFHIARP